MLADTYSCPHYNKITHTSKFNQARTRLQKGRGGESLERDAVSNCKRKKHSNKWYLPGGLRNIDVKSMKKEERVLRL